MKPKANIYAVAEKANVSIATVSRLMNSPEKVSSKTRERVMAAMAELNFSPNAEAVAKARKGVKRIGILSPYFTAPSFIQRIRGVQRVLAQTGFDLVTYSVENKEHLKTNLDMLPVSNRIDGLINMSLPMTGEEIKRFMDKGIPIISIETDLPGVSSITIDDCRGGEMAAAHLLEKGYERLAFIGEKGQPAYTLRNNKDRLEGFSGEIAKRGKRLMNKNVLHHYYGLKNSEECIRELLSRPDRPDGVFFSSDLQAMVALKVARELEISVPEQLGIIGFDDIDVSEYMGITTVRQALDDSGSMAADMLLDILRQGEYKQKNIILDLEIIERVTT